MVGFLRSLEMLFSLSILYDMNSTQWQMIPALKLAGSLPTPQNWMEDCDSALLCANWVKARRI